VIGSAAAVSPDAPHAPVMEPGGSSFRPTLVLMSGRALAFLATFFIPVVLARIFDQATFGTYRQVFLVYATVYCVAQFGMADSLFYFIPGAGPRGGAFVANALLFLTAAASVCTLGLWAAAPRIAAWLSNPALAGQMSVAALFIGLSLISMPLEMVMIARKRHLPAALAYGLSDLLRAGCLLVPAIVFGGLRALLWGAVVFAVCRLAAALAYMKGTYGHALWPRADALRPQLAYSVPFGLAVILEIMQTTFHQYAVSHYFDAAAFAVYSVGCLTIPLVDFVVGPAGNVMMVRMSEAIAAGRPEAVLSIWHDTTRKLALVVVPLMAFSIVTAPALIVFLFTARYAASARIFMIWSTGILWSSLITDGVLRVHADTRFILILNGVKLTVNILLMSFFIFTFGLPGAVMVTLAATALAKIAALARAQKLMGVGLAELLPWGALGRVGAAAALAAGPALLVPSGLPPIVVLFARGAAYAGSYVLLVLCLGGLSPAERRFLSGAGWASPAAPPVR
jgi:O-antigen/teichoic acid export membrane protein